MPTSNDDDRSTDRPRDKGRRDRDDRPRRRDRDRDRDDDDDLPDRRRDKATGSGALVVVGIIFGVLVVGAFVMCGLVALLMPAVQKVREAAARQKDMNNMKQISLAMHDYHDANGTLPPAQDPVSWRVYLLPYVEQANVYRQMDVTQPWDAPVNRPFARQRIPTYVSVPDPPETVETRYRVFVGPHTLYEPGQRPMNFANVNDGTSNTIFVVEAGEMVPWSAPRELVYDRNAPLPPLGAPGRNGFLVGMLDGSVRFVPDPVSPDAMRGGIEPNDGRFFDP